MCTLFFLILLGTHIRGAAVRDTHYFLALLSSPFPGLILDDIPAVGNISSVRG